MMMIMITITIIRRLQYSDERDDYNHMDTSRLIEEEAQYNAWSFLENCDFLNENCEIGAKFGNQLNQIVHQPTASQKRRYSAICLIPLQDSPLVSAISPYAQKCANCDLRKIDAKFVNQLNQIAHQNAWLQCHSLSKKSFETFRRSAARCSS